MGKGRISTPFDSNSSRWLLSALAVCGGGAILSTHSVLVGLVGVDHAYSLGTLVLLTAAASVIVVWPRDEAVDTPSRTRLLPALLTVVAGAGVLCWVATGLLQPVFAGPLDSRRGDMLVIMEHAIKRLLDGGNPYTVHQVPWDAPLTYGPVLWLPHLVSYLLHFDFRIFTLIAQLFIPALCFICAGFRVGQVRSVRAAALFLIGAGIALHPGLRGFHQIGHTQVYWPLLAVFCVLLRQGRWLAASVVLGLLVSARTPLLALAPVFFLHLHVKGQLTLGRLSAFGAALLLPYLPFLIWDPVAVKDGMFDTYVRVMKTYVWQSTRWAVDTYGLTGRLLEYGKQQYVELAQLLCLGVTYIVAWRSMARGRNLEPWLAFALLVFAMTTLWSVFYLYYDVWLLLACGLVVHDGSWNGSPLRSAGRVMALAFTIATVSVFAMAAASPGSKYTLNIGAPQSAGYTGGGFGADVPEADDGRAVVWVEGVNGRIRLPRAGWTGARIRIAIRPSSADPAARQTILAALNGHGLGRVSLKEGWQEVTFASKRRDWLYGFNVLELFFDYASPRGQSPREGKEYAAAIDFIVVE